MLVLRDREVHALRICGDDIALQSLTTLPVHAQCVACADAAGTLYYVPQGDATRLCVWRAGQHAASATADAAQWPYAARAVLYYRCKVYSLARDVACLMSYDPLCGDVETHTIPWPARSLASAGDGVALLDEDGGSVCVYDVNTGTAHAVTCHGASRHVRLLGSYKQYAVLCRDDDGSDGNDARPRPRARGACATPTGHMTATTCASAATSTAAAAVAPSSSLLYFVGEAGVCVTPGATVTLPRCSFVMLDDAVVLYVDAGTRCLVAMSGPRSRPLPVGDAAEALLCAAPRQTGEEQVCTLCLCDVEPGDSLTLDCGHCFHIACTEEWVQSWDAFRRQGRHITFTRARCPGGCKRLVRHPRIAASHAIQTLHAAVVAVTRAVLVDAEPTRTADDVLLYVCAACDKPFWGGDRVCARMLASEPANAPSSLLCDDCVRDFVCARHGRQFVVYQCRYCCNPATHRSFATRYLCERCHARWTGAAEPTVIACPGAAHCPLRGRHGDGTDTHVIGCLACLPDDALALDKVVAAPLDALTQT